MYLPLKIAARYFKSKKSTNVINMITGVAISGIVIGSMALIVVLSVYNGFENLVFSLYHMFDPEVKITSDEGKTFSVSDSTYKNIITLEGVEAASRTLEENVLLKYKDKQYIATIKGVDTGYEKVTGVDSAIYRGKYMLKKAKEDYAVIGAGVHIALGTSAEPVPSIIQIYVPKRTTGFTLNPEKAFRKKMIKTGGVFSIQQQFDSQYMFASLEFTRELLNYEDKLTSIELKLKPEAASKKVIKNLEEIMGNGFKVLNRYEQNVFLYKIMKTEKWAIYAILTFIMIILGFNIVGSLSMLVIDKTKDIGTLKTLGATKGMIRKIFLLEGVIMSVTGTLAGAFLGILICLAQQHFKLIKLGSPTFVIDAYPVELQWQDFVLVFITVAGIGIVASWFPAQKATQQKWVFKEE